MKLKGISLPISKSIANRILLLQAIHGDELMPVSATMPDDVRVLHDALEQLREYGHRPIYTSPHPLVLHLKNCGTALRFLQVHLDICYPGEPIVLDGDERLKERDGKPTSQTTSALILHGVDIPDAPDESPYITMTRKLMKSFSEQRERSFSETVFQRSGLSGVAGLLEADWSAASYWYEYVAIHGGELLLEGLTSDSIQGDRIVADLYAEHFGVQTTFTPEGAVIHQTSNIKHQTSVSLNFERTPDLYPAIALTCERLGIELVATGTERLRFKESDRLEAVRLHEARKDHRMVMALLAADFPVSENDQVYVAKSYPQFVEQLSIINYQLSITHITPIRGVNDDNLGKKHALSKLIHAATSDYLWLHDDDVIWPPVCQPEGRSVSETVCQCNGLSGEAGQMADLLILPLKMESEQSKPSLLERLQIAEYAAIQELTMRTAKKGRAVMCSGANLIVRRQAWLQCEPDLHPEIPSGDDMFLLEAMKRRGYKVGVIDEPEFTAVVRSETSWRAFFRQRMRWAGKAAHYTDPDIRRCGALVAAANILQLLCPPIILIKFPFEYALIRRRQSQIPNHQSPITRSVLPINGGRPCPLRREGLNQSPITNHQSPITNFLTALLLELLYPFYLLICLVGGLFRKKKW